MDIVVVSAGQVGYAVMVGVVAIQLGIPALNGIYN